MQTEESMSPNSGKEKNPHTLGWITIIVIFGLLGLWAVLAQIETTVQTGGKVISMGYRKLIQHPKGGLVTHLYVKEGDKVKKGQVLMRLDDVEVDSRLQSNIDQYDQLLMEQARLEAESHLSPHVDFNASLAHLIHPQKGETLLQRQKALFNSNLRQLRIKQELLRNRNNILKEQNRGLEAKIASDRRQLDSFRQELAKWQKLYEKNMTDELKLLDLKRKIESIEAEIAQSQSKIRENEATMQSNKQQIQLVENEYVNKARKRLQEITMKLDSLREQIRGLQNTKQRLEITAPGAGTIVDMKIHSDGEVIPPQKSIAFIVPENKKLLLELFIKPTDIDKVHVGQMTDIKFPSYVDPAAKPIEGKITYVSADVISSPDGKHSYYKALTEITPKGMKAIKENGFQIIPGMPVSAYIKAGKRSFLSYILLPLERLARGAFHAN